MASFLFYCRRFLTLIVLALLAGGGVVWWRVTHPLHKIAVIPARCVYPMPTGFLTSDLNGTFSLHDWKTGKVLWVVVAAPSLPTIPWASSGGNGESLLSVSFDGHYLVTVSMQKGGACMQVWRDGQPISNTWIPQRQVPGIFSNVWITSSGQVYLVSESEYKGSSSDSLDQTARSSSREKFFSETFHIFLYAQGRCVATGKQDCEAYLVIESDGQMVDADRDEYLLIKRGNRLLLTQHNTSPKPLHSLSGKPKWKVFPDYPDSEFQNGEWILQHDSDTTCRVYQPSTNSSWTFRSPIPDIVHHTESFSEISSDGRYILLYFSAAPRPEIAFLQNKLPFLHLTHREGNCEELYVYERPGILRAQAVVSPDDDRNTNAAYPFYFLSPDGKSLLVRLMSSTSWQPTKAVLYRW